MVCDNLVDDIAPVKSSVAILLLLLNIFIPGLGTIVNSFFGGKCRATTFIVGLLQLLLASFILGWIWSIWWGVLIYEKATD